MKRILIPSILLLLGCDVPNMFGKSKNDGSVSSISCSSNGFGPVPFSIPTKIEKIFISEKLSKSRETLEQANLFGLFDSSCLATSRLSKQLATLTDIRTNSTTPKKNNRLDLEVHKIKPSPKLTLSQFKKIINSDPCVLKVEEDIEFHLDATPNDPQFSNSAHLSFLGMPTAWDVFFHATSGINQDVVVAIIDNGGDFDHPDLNTNRWINPGEIAGNATDDDANGYIDDVNGYNFSSSSGDPSPQAGNVHGTEVAGVIGAQYNNNVGSTGLVGNHVKLMHLNAAGAGATVTNAAAVEAIIYAANNDADVVNMSFGVNQEVPAMRLAIEQAVAAGVFFSASAGNAGQQLTSTYLNVPGSYAPSIDGLMSVGSVLSSTGEYVSFSNYSSHYVEIMAPGGDSLSLGIFTTVPGSDPVNSYTRGYGTSLSAPMVAGAAALAIGYLRTHGQSPTPADIETLLDSSAETVSSLSGRSKNCKSLNILNLSEEVQ